MLRTRAELAQEPAALIVGGFIRRVIGEQVIIRHDALGNAAEQPAVILREATRDEWIQCVCRHGGTPLGEHVVQYFYEVSTD